MSQTQLLARTDRGGTIQPEKGSAGFEHQAGLKAAGWESIALQQGPGLRQEAIILSSAED